MTERQWLDCTDPSEMLTWLMGHDATTAMRRRLKPVVEACRLIFNPDGLWPPIESSESLKDAVDFWLRGSTPIEPDVRSAIIRDVIGNPFRSVTIEQAWLTPLVLSLARAVDDAASEAIVCPNCFGKEHVREDGPYTSKSDRVTCGRCKGFGEFPPDGTFDPVRLAVLADALLDGGMPDTLDRIPHPLLAHLRDAGPHWRGCHAVSCILNKGGDPT